MEQVRKVFLFKILLTRTMLMNPTLQVQLSLGMPIFLSSALIMIIQMPKLKKIVLINWKKLLVGERVKVAHRWLAVWSRLFLLKERESIERKQRGEGCVMAFGLLCWCPNFCKTPLGLQKNGRADWSTDKYRTPWDGSSVQTARSSRRSRWRCPDILRLFPPQISSRTAGKEMTRLLSGHRKGRHIILDVITVIEGDRQKFAHYSTRGK